MGTSGFSCSLQYPLCSAQCSCEFWFAREIIWDYFSPELAATLYKFYS